MNPFECRSRLRGFLLAFAATATPGCLWYPVHACLDQQRGRPAPALLHSWTPGSTNREQVLLELGEPDWVGDGGQRIVYWNHESTSALWFWVVVDTDVVVFGKHRLLGFQFDGPGRLQEVRTRERSFTQRMDDPAVRPSEAEFLGLFESQPGPPAPR